MAAGHSRFFLFGPQKKAGVVPTAFVDFGFRASFGIYAFWDDLFVEDNHLRLHATTYGKDWLSGAIADRIPIGNESTVDFRLEGVHRPDQIFAGIGPRTQEYQRTRNGVDRFEAHPVFEADACCDEPSLVSEVRAGRATLPRGFEGYTNLYQRGDFTIDTREARPADQTGLRLELEAEHGSNIRTSTANWVRYGGSVGGFVDIENNRTISLSVTTLFVDPMSSGARIPFTENIILGGSGPMRGYLLGRLNDRSAAIATVKYPLADLGISRRHAAGRNGQRVRTAAREFQACAPSSLGRDRHREHRRGGSHLRALGGRRERDLEQRGSIDSFRLLFGTNRGF